MRSYQDISADFFSQYGKIVIDLGCGPNKKPGTIGVDILEIQGVDFVANLEEGLSFIPDNSVDQYVTSHFLEHVDQFELLMAEMHRTLKPNGTVNIIVPHFSNPYYYSDYTHKRFFGLYTFDYFTDNNNGFRRKVPVYNRSFQYKVTYRKLIFKSPYIFFINLIKKHIYTRLFNSGKYMQALYEDSFSSLIPCYELVFELQAVK
jgi:ubiquinone/menaquinone biosynthesis C-methylase UbiE